jgi:hypothetical protein
MPVVTVDTKVAGFLRDELTDHFRLEPSLVTTNVIDRIFEWWESVKQRQHPLIGYDRSTGGR